MENKSNGVENVTSYYISVNMINLSQKREMVQLMPTSEAPCAYPHSSLIFFWCMLYFHSLKLQFTKVNNFEQFMNSEGDILKTLFPSSSAV